MKQIYIVDDDESVRRALKLLMVSYKFRVDTFSSAVEFFSAVPDSTPGCLLFKEKSLKAGVAGILYKPFEGHYLLHMVSGCLLKQ